MLANLKSVDEENFEVQFEVVPVSESIIERDERKGIIYRGIAEIDDQLDILNAKLDELNCEIDRLTNHADGIDYMVAVGSGIITGIIDVLFVEDFSIEKANDWGTEKTNSFVIKIAQQQGYEGNDLYGAVKFLEEKYPIAADKVTNDFGGGLQHHLRDFSHHPTPVGLLFSLLTQFTRKVYGTDVAGVFRIVELKKDDLVLIGNSFPEQIMYGVVNWFFHMVSDMAGSSSSILNGKTGTGLPGPIVSLLKEVSALPIFQSMNDKGYKEFSVWISKLFNGTLLGSRSDNGNLVEPMKFDLRTELGVAHQLGKQTVPVIINECIVRGFYFIRHLLMEMKSSNIHGIKEMGNIHWKNTLPFKNRTIARMITISTGTMTAIDVADAAIESAINSGGITNPAFVKNMIVKVNFVGVGRFAIAVCNDISMGVKKSKVKKERSNVLSQMICMSNVKMYYMNAELLCAYSELYNHERQMHEAEADLWLALERTSQCMDALYEWAAQVGKLYIYFNDEMDKSFDRIEELLPEVEKMNPGLVDKMRRRLKR